MRIFSKSQTGLSLIEAIIFILILAIALGAILAYIYTPLSIVQILYSL